MAFLTALLTNRMYNSALFDQDVPSSRALKVVPMSLQNFFTSDDICSPDISATIESAAPTSLANCLMAITEVYHFGHFWLSYGRCTMSGSPLGMLLGLSW